MVSHPAGGRGPDREGRRSGRRRRRSLRWQRRRQATDVPPRTPTPRRDESRPTTRSSTRTATSVTARCRSSCCSTSAATSTTGTPRSSTRSPRIDAWSRSTTSASAPRPAGRRTPSRRWPTDAIAFIEAMDFERVDLLGFSIGSFVAQEIALIRPDLLRRVVLASSAPQGAAGMHGWAPEVIGAVGAPETTPQGYISRLLRPHRHESRSGPASRRTHLRRKDNRPRRTDDVADPPGAVRRRLRVGHSQPLAAPASRRDRPPGVRRQRRQRPDDPALATRISWPGSSRTRGSRSTRTRRTAFSSSTTASSPPTCTPSSRRPTDADDRRLRRGGNLLRFAHACAGPRGGGHALGAGPRPAAVREQHGRVHSRHGCSRDLQRRGRQQLRASPGAHARRRARPRQAARGRQGAHGDRRRPPPATRA